MATDSRIVTLGLGVPFLFLFTREPGQRWRKVSNIGATEIKISRIKNEIIKNIIQMMWGSLNIPIIVALLLFVVIHFDYVILVSTFVVFSTFISLVGFRDFL